MSAEDGDKSYLRHHAVSISNFFVHTEFLSERIWIAFPLLPIIIEYGYDGAFLTPDDEDNLVAALERHDRVLSIKLTAMSSQLEKVITVMSNGPFPVLTVLRLSLDDSVVQRRLVIPELVLPGGFLGGSAPRLREIFLNCAPFPMLPTLLLSSHGLVTLDLSNMPQAGYLRRPSLIKYSFLLKYGPSFPLSPRLTSKVLTGMLRTSQPESTPLNSREST